MESQKITLNVEGMSCSHCSGMVQKTLEQISGIANVKVDLDAKKASFDAQTSARVDMAIKAINEAGYTALPLQG